MLKKSKKTVISSLKRREISFLGFLATQATLEMTMPASLWACPLCADLIARSQDTVHALGFGRGIFWSILILLGVPLALGVSFSLFLISAARKREKSMQKNML